MLVLRPFVAGSLDFHRTWRSGYAVVVWLKGAGAVLFLMLSVGVLWDTGALRAEVAKSRIDAKRDDFMVMSDKK